MIFTKTPLKGSYVIDITPIKDDRGFFSRAFCAEEFKQHNLYTTYVQSNISYNEKRGIIRGMHYQIAPYEEVKLVRCYKGSIYDVIIDMRKDSLTYLKWFGETLSENNYKMMYVPKGFAHGYQALTDGATVFYMTGAMYNKESERGVRWNDTKINIQWPLKEGIRLSDKDSSIKLL